MRRRLSTISSVLILSLIFAISGTAQLSRVPVGSHLRTFYPEWTLGTTGQEIVALQGSTTSSWEYKKPYAQMSFAEKASRPTLSILWQVATVLAGGIGDGLMDNGSKHWGHALRAVEAGMLISGPFVFDLERRDALPWLSGYLLFRVGMKDWAYNLTRELPLTYTGTTSVYDDVMSGIPPHGQVWIKSICIMTGFGITIKHL